MPSQSPPDRSTVGVGTSRSQAILLLVVGNSLWAGSYVAGKEALRCLSFIELNALRFSISTILLAPVLWSGRRILAGELRNRASLNALARLVLLGFVLNKAFEYAGLSLSTAVDVALLIATEGIFTAILSWTLLGEPVTGGGVAALIAGAAGTWLVIARGLVPDFGGPGGAGRIIGDLMVVLSLLFEAGYTVTGKASLKRIPPLLIIAISVAGCLLVWLPAAAIALARDGMPHMTNAAWASVGYMAAFGTVAAYWMWFRGLSVVHASVAAPFLFIQPLLGAALGVAMLGETISWATMAGAVLIVASLAMVTAESRRTLIEPPA
ncbi:MAG TPA: DMT family transporter [Candidatus Binataceae bacterium]|nr:DMT family transporter [Candidatus Binataceae bacterium]